MKIQFLFWFFLRKVEHAFRPQPRGSLRYGWVVLISPSLFLLLTIVSHFMILVILHNWKTWFGHVSNRNWHQKCFFGECRFCQKFKLDTQVLQDAQSYEWVFPLVEETPTQTCLFSKLLNFGAKMSKTINKYFRIVKFLFTRNKIAHKVRMHLGRVVRHWTDASDQLLFHRYEKK